MRTLARPLLPDDRVAAAPGILASQLDGEAVLLDPEGGTYYALSEVAARFWAFLEGGSGALGDLHKRLLSEYEVEPGRLWGDLVELVERLWEEGLVEVEKGASPRATAP